MLICRPICSQSIKRQIPTYWTYFRNSSLICPFLNLVGLNKSVSQAIFLYFAHSLTKMGVTTHQQLRYHPIQYESHS